MPSKGGTGAAPGRWTTAMLALLAGGGLVAAMALILTVGGSDKPPATPPAAAAASPALPATMQGDAAAGAAAPRTDAPAPGAPSLVGRWARQDGDYLLDIRGVGAGGKVEAGYFNPDPIRVSRAEVTGEGDARSLFVELRDVNYPGCTYNLRHDAANDRLVGVYYQAALQQKFDVIFERMR
jgi:hypothetical protein